MQELPQETEVLILSYLPVRDPLSYSEVSQDSHVLCQDQHLWRQLFLKDFGSVCPHYYAQLLSTVGYYKLYQKYHDLMKRLFIKLTLRTETKNTAQVNNVSELSEVVLSGGHVTLMKFYCPLEADLEPGSPYYTKWDNNRSHLWVFATTITYDSRECFLSTIKEAQLLFEGEWTKQTLEDSLRDHLSQGYKRQLETSSTINPQILDPEDKEVRELIRWGLIIVSGLEGDKIRELLDSINSE